MKFGSIGKVSLLAMAVALAACDSDDDNSVPEGTEMEVRLMESTDIHMYLMNYNYFTGKDDNNIGLVKVASLIADARNESENTVLVDNGDLIQGSPMGDYMNRKGLQDGEIHPVYKAMNLMSYDVGNIGNHEFNYGLEFLQESIDDAGFPYISANVFRDDGDNNPDNDQPVFEPYHIVDKQFKDKSGVVRKLKVGFIGFVPPQIMQWDKSNLDGKVIAKDIVEMAERYVPEMKRKGADLIVAIPHSGLMIGERQQLEENATYHLASVAGIDAIMFGHAHQNFPGGASYDGYEGQGVDNVNGTINGVPAVMPGFWGNHLGIIDLDLSFTDGSWAVKGSSVELRQSADVNPEQAIVDAVSEEHEATSAWVSEPFAKISAEVNSYFALVQDDPSIQIVSDAQIDYGVSIVQGTELEGLPVLSAAAPFRAGRQGADDYTFVPAGDVAYRNVADLYIYPNTVKVLMLSGAEVKEWLEMSAGQFNQIDPQATTPQALINTAFPSYNFDVIDGVTYQIDVSQPAKYNTDGTIANQGASRIVNLNYAGQPVVADQQFLVVTNNYRASGGGRFPNVDSSRIVVDSPDENRQVLANYIAKQAEQNPDTGFDPSSDNNWGFLPINDSVKVLFTSSNSEQAQAFAVSLPKVLLTDVVEGGFRTYEIDFK
ncbi:2':3'-cyclic-nucleotide 2'-phosphodiesterase [Oleiphilus messinensis]|uniref:2':3'-cyclic-nucleotide 2'-phosphodiesterase n=1 Tax=Oleiphilus messinensis TaxID=141451 RepID=A0A1Y0IB05_9GAMM|nr:bifunctional 2',3'-cyclic-nucleotide 2'-phosphodiesterase/3'-nucleotidase [Oleiphilus messinensis]ARU56573.1 2':3'-cyclic-nucleotide 2'-phosphodiesterase [Oleiphilus messinensis]